MWVTQKAGANSKESGQWVSSVPEIHPFRVSVFWASQGVPHKESTYYRRINVLYITGTGYDSHPEIFAYLFLSLVLAAARGIILVTVQDHSFPE